MLRVWDTRIVFIFSRVARATGAKFKLIARHFTSVQWSVANIMQPKLVHDIGFDHNHHVDKLTLLHQTLEL